MIWLTIFLMTLIVFSSRYMFLAPKLPLKLNAEAQKLLSYSSPAVLTAIWAPIVFLHEGKPEITLQIPYLISAVIAALIAWKTKNVLVTAVISMTVFFLLTTFI
ncbi:AzlD domain-containing protein [Photobacterium sp. J15]|uniref:AzlD domain-containing protein n=1 Tax=Photobacterium sp. J15 TaxID=265901 RepID=UPI0007E2E8B3|nr:AzlD domain-containing protein [Photobacterium sp. J15]